MAARQGVPAAVIAFVMIAAPAEATTFKGSVTDARSDTVNGGTSGHDIVQAAAVSDDAGAAAVAIQLAAAPASNGYPVGILGTRTADGRCADPGVVFAGHVGTRSASYAVTGGTAKPATLTVDGDTVTLAADRDPGLARTFDCAVAGIAANAALSAYYDETPLIALAADAPPAPTPVPTPAAPAPTPAPAPTTATTPPVPVPQQAKLAITLSGTPSTVRRNRTMKLKLKVANQGAKRSAKIAVSVAKARGLSVSRVKPMKALDPAKSRTVTLKVKLSRKARTSTSLKVTVKAGKLKQTSSVLLRIGKARKVGAGAPPAPKNPLVGTYWWRTVTQVDFAWDNRALYFADGAGVYSGFPAGGLPAACTTPVQSPEDEFDTREGCLPYTYDARTGAVTIADKSGTFADGKLTVDGAEYTPLAIPQAGARFAFNEHRHFSFRGLCGMILGCTTSQQYLSLGADGRFIWTRQSLTTTGDPGIGPWTAVGSYPPDQHGTYEVLAGGKLRLAYADGTVKEETFAVDTNPAGQPDPLGTGVLVGEDNFYPDS